MENMQYVCPKCGCKSYVDDQFQATGGNFAKVFDIQNKKFITISCADCGIYGIIPGENINRHEYFRFPDRQLRISE